MFSCKFYENFQSRCSEHNIWLGASGYKIWELHKGRKHPQCNSDFINKIEVQSNIE